MILIPKIDLVFIQTILTQNSFTLKTLDLDFFMEEKTHQVVNHSMPTITTLHVLHILDSVKTNKRNHYFK